MPPGRNFLEDCMVYLDTLTITFDDTGFFASSPANAFDPELPIGLFYKGSTIGPFKAVKKTDAYLGFFDIDTKTLFVETLHIKDSCP